jgi:hypothetical protein
VARDDRKAGSKVVRVSLSHLHLLPFIISIHPQINDRLMIAKPLLLGCICAIVDFIPLVV